MDNDTMIIGNVSSTLFWNEPWLDEDVLRERFSRLFNFALEKNATLKDMVLGSCVEIVRWSWRINLFVWKERLVVKCNVLLTNISLHDSTKTIWYGILIMTVCFYLKKITTWFSILKKLFILLCIKSFGIICFHWRYHCLLEDCCITAFLLKIINVKRNEKFSNTFMWWLCNLNEISKHLFFECPVYKKISP